MIVLLDIQTKSTLQRWFATEANQIVAKTDELGVAAGAGVAELNIPFKYPGDYLSLDGSAENAMVTTLNAIIDYINNSGLLPVVIPTKTVGSSFTADEFNRLVAKINETATWINDHTSVSLLAQWGWSATDPFTDLAAGIDNITYQGNQVLANNSDNIVADFHSMPDYYYTVTKVPSSVSLKTTITDSAAPYNIGTIPDNTNREAFTVAGSRYYVARVPTVYDKSPSSRVTYS